MNSNNQLTKAIRLALVFGAAATAGVASNANAVEEAQVEEVERIQVTGSRIKRSDMETASPVTVIDASAIAASGVTSIDGILQSMTSVGGAMTNPGINNGSGGNARVNLRGLGSNRTLVLVNGRRMIASGTGAASSVDLNTIPVSMIQRIEVLKDGASAVYGTDAVSGVVNVILKRDYNGAEFNAQVAQSGESDAEETNLDFTVGASNDKGNVVFGVQYTDRGEAKQADREFSECPIAEGSDGLFCAGSPYAQGGHIWGDKNHGIVGSGPKGKYAIGDSGHYGEYVADEDGDPKFKYFEGMSEADLSGRGGSYHDFVYSGDKNDRYNYSADSYLFTPMHRLNLSVSGNYEISDTTTFFSEAMYTKRWSSQQMAPQPIWNSQSWAYDSNWMNTELSQWAQEGEKLDYGRRMVESGTRNFSQSVDTVRVVLGLEGELDNGFYWDVSYNKGRNDSVDKLANLHNIGSINDAVQLGNKLSAEGMSKEEILAAGAFDPFTQSSWEGDSITPFIYTELNNGGSEMDIFAATLSGELAELPAGVVGFSVGVEHRTESAFYTPDSLTAQGLANDPPVEPTSGSFNVDEAYFELAVPLLNNLPFAEQVDLSAAVRYFDYNTFGDDNTWKLGLTWKINDQLMVRGVSSTAFRAPTVSELYSGNSPSFEQITHPATTQTQAEVTVGGNGDLTPEEADIFTAGFVYEPEYVEGLSVTVDYYDIEITNAIGSVDDNYIANLCLDASGNKINTGTAVCQSADIEIDGTGRIAFNNQLQNIGGQKTSGYDVNFAYNFAAAGLDWKVGLDTSILDEFEESDQDGNVLDYKGFITGGSGAYAELKSNLNVNVQSDDWDFTYEMRYIDSMDSYSCKDDPDSCYAPDVGSIIYHDLSGAFHVTDSVTLSGGINNILDEEPPYYTGNNDANTDPYTYDVLGRYFFVKAGIKF